jgi:hypothetical protein
MLIISATRFVCTVIVRSLMHITPLTESRAITIVYGTISECAAELLTTLATRQAASARIIPTTLMTTLMESMVATRMQDTMVATQMRVVMVVTHIEPHSSQCYHTGDSSQYCRSSARRLTEKALCSFENSFRPARHNSTSAR